MPDDPGQQRHADPWGRKKTHFLKPCPSLVRNGVQKRELRLSSARECLEGIDFVELADRILACARDCERWQQVLDKVRIRSRDSTTGLRGIIPAEIVAYEQVLAQRFQGRALSSRPVPGLEPFPHDRIRSTHRAPPVPGEARSLFPPGCEWI